MSRLCSISVIVATAFAGSSAIAQSYYGVIDAMVDGKKVPLERKSATMESRGRLAGLGGMDMYWKYEGAHSSVRFHSGQNISFTVRVASQDIDPATYLLLSSVTTKHDERRLIMASQGIYGGVRTNVTKQQVSVSYTPLGKSNMKIEPTSPLAPGEYVITSSGPTNGFLFGID